MAAKPKKTTKPEASGKETKPGASEILETIRSIKTKFGDESIMTLAETKHVDIEAVPQGQLASTTPWALAATPEAVSLRSTDQNRLVKPPFPSMQSLKHKN